MIEQKKTLEHLNVRKFHTHKGFNVQSGMWNPRRTMSHVEVDDDVQTEAAAKTGKAQGVLHLIKQTDRVILAEFFQNAFQTQFI